MSKGKRIFLTVVGIVAVIAVIVLLSKLLGGDDNFSEKYEGTNLETDGEFERDDTYAVYIKSHEDSALYSVCGKYYGVPDCAGAGRHSHRSP